MDEHTLARVTEILATDPDFYVPVRRLWLMLREEGLAPDLGLETFHAHLAADDRFEFIEGVDHAEGLAEDPEFAAEMERGMEALGFSGPRVKLVGRDMTAEDVFAGLSRSLEQLSDALRGAWETRPDGDAETEGMLLDALTMAEELEREIQEIIDEQGKQPPQEDETS